MDTPISVQIDDTVAEFLGTHQVEKRKHVSDQMIDNAKQTGMKKVESAMGNWFVRIFAYEKKVFAQVQTPDKEIYYILPKALAEELNEMEKNPNTLVVPLPKPRDTTQQVLANKKNAAGAHRDKKREMKDGKFKHKGQVMETGMKLSFKQFIQEMEEEGGNGLFSYKIEYKNARTGYSFGGEWKDIDLSHYDLMTAKDIAKRVLDHQGPDASGDVGFITEIVQPHLAFPHYPHSFEPQDYDLISERHGIVKIQIVYDLRDPDHRPNFHQHGKVAILTFMERAE